MITKELQDLAWICLPKEFKEAVKKEYKDTFDNEPWEMPAKGYIRGRLRMMRELFGEHNLTSDAEGEEMLTCKKNKVTELYSKLQKDGSTSCLFGMAVLDTLFGSKCLPDKSNLSENLTGSQESKPAEPTVPNYLEKLNSSHHIADTGKMVDDIIKDGFRDHNRLHVDISIKFE